MRKMPSVEDCVQILDLTHEELYLIACGFVDVVSNFVRWGDKAFGGLPVMTIYFCLSKKGIRCSITGEDLSCIENGERWVDEEWGMADVAEVGVLTARTSIYYHPMKSQWHVYNKRGKTAFKEISDQLNQLWQGLRNVSNKKVDEMHELNIFVRIAEVDGMDQEDIDEWKHPHTIEIRRGKRGVAWSVCVPMP